MNPPKKCLYLDHLELGFFKSRRDAHKRLARLIK